SDLTAGGVTRAGNPMGLPALCPMQHDLVDELVADLCAELGEPVPERTPVRVWGMSGVERMPLSTGPVIVKYAQQPFDREDAILVHCYRHGLAMPRLLASTHLGHTMGMLLQDLGEPARQPSLPEAAAAAHALHTTPAPDGVPVLDAASLAALPKHALGHLDVLHRQ